MIVPSGDVDDRDLVNGVVISYGHKKNRRTRTVPASPAVFVMLTRVVTSAADSAETSAMSAVPTGIYLDGLFQILLKIIGG